MNKVIGRIWISLFILSGYNSGFIGLSR